EDKKPVAEQVAQDGELGGCAPLPAAGFDNNFTRQGPALREFAREQYSFCRQVSVQDIEVDAEELPQQPMARNARNSKQSPIGPDEVGHPYSLAYERVETKPLCDSNESASQHAVLERGPPACRFLIYVGILRSASLQSDIPRSFGTSVRIW